MKNALFISPHADDVELGCGGTIAKYVQSGTACTVLVCTASDMQMVHSQHVAQASTRVHEQLQASKILGVQTTEFLNIGPEQELDAQSRLKLVSVLDKYIAQGFDELFIPLPSYNQDHVHVYEACLTACRPTKADSMRVVAYEQAFQHVVGPTVCNQLQGAVYERLTHDQLLLKLNAISAHDSQVQGRSHTVVGTRGALFLAQLRGLEAGADYAEKFYLIRETR